MSVLKVEGLTVRIPHRHGEVTAVEDVSFELERGRVLALVGESGSGKSVACQTIMGFRPTRDTDVSGQVLVNGRDVRQLSAKDLRRMRGSEMSMIFQDPMTSLNPVVRVGMQLAEAIHVHRSASRTAARARALEMLDLVGISDPAARIDDYPHQFSGGMRQRVMIAMALINEPELVIADEPTASLDVATQTKIIALLGRLQRETGTACLIVTHDLRIVSAIADDVLVMYAGRSMERAPVVELLEQPHHPYTWGLLGALPAGVHVSGDRPRLVPIPGGLPSPSSPPPGCRFEPRCGHAMAACSQVVPVLQPLPGASPLHTDACLLDADQKRTLARAVVQGGSRG